MKRSITTKIMFWFSLWLIIMVGITFLIIINVSGEIIKKTIKDNLIEVVENNVDEIEYFVSIDNIDINSDVDYFIDYDNGYLEIDDDFLDEVNGVYTGLYSSDNTLIYGENPVIVDTKDLEFVDAVIQTITIGNTTYYVYDRMLTSDNLEGLFLRGIVSEEQGDTSIASIINISLIIMPTLLLITIGGGYILIRKLLYPIKEITREVEEITDGKDLKLRIRSNPNSKELYILVYKFNEMLDCLEKSFESEKEFTKDASHELRTPLSVISAEIELLLEDKQSVDDYINGLNVIGNEASKMKNIVNDLLILTRTDNCNIKFKNVNLSKLVSNVCKNMILINKSNITLITDIDKNINILGSSDLLERLLINLIDNAYKYGCDKGHIWVSLKDNILSIKDDGIGIGKKNLDNIFNRFYQVSDSRNNFGAGLGLSIVKNIVDIHGASIDVISKINKGTTFTIKFKN